MRALAAAFLLVLASALPTAALADELIRFRTPDGVLGLVDHADKVPPGATILSREPKPTAAGRAAALEPAAEAEHGVSDEPAEEAPPRARRRPPRPGVPTASASPDEEAALVADWCEQATDLRLAREEAEADVEAERERYERCEMVDAYCSERDVEAAEERLDDALAEEEALADDCRRADCLPGWIREGCERLP